MNFKYTTQFTVANIKVSSFQLDQKVSKASLENLMPLIPNGEIDFNENIDLLGLAFNAAVVNKFNKNDDGIDTQTALRIATLFKHKPTNIEHKKEKVVGHILTAGFSRIGDSELFIPDSNYVDPFNISLGAVVYKYVNKDFASALEESNDETSNLYNKISTSWELGFNDYNIAVGSDNLNDAEIITDENHIKELKGKLKSYGGSGCLDDGTKIYAEINSKKAITLENMIRVHGKELALEKYEQWKKKILSSNKRYSKGGFLFCKELHQLLIQNLNNETPYYGDNEYSVVYKKEDVIKQYFPDFLIKSQKIIVEYYGDYWHRNPEKYSGEQAEKIWELDKQRIYNLNELGYKVFYVYESDITKNYKNTIELLLKEINESWK